MHSQSYFTQTSGGAWFRLADDTTSVHCSVRLCIERVFVPHKMMHPSVQRGMTSHGFSTSSARPSVSWLAMKSMIRFADCFEGSAFSNSSSCRCKSFCCLSTLLNRACPSDYIVFKESDADDLYLNECFLYGGSEQLCRVLYFGTHILYPLLIGCAIVDFAGLWSEADSVRYLKNRLVWFSLALLLSSCCTLANLIGNADVYEQHILANTSYVTCTFGYVLVIFVASLSILIQCDCFANWRTERRATRVLGYLTLMAVLFIQSRTFADLFVFSLMCLVMASDIQVVKET